VVGLIQKVLFDLVDVVGPAGAADEIKRRAGIPTDRTYRIDVVYPDEEWRRLLAAASEVLAIPRAELMDAYAEHFYRDAIKRWPAWWRTSKGARELLERQPVIHNCFAAGVQDPELRQNINDKFVVERAPNELVVHYRSPNRLCDLYLALAKRVLDHYREQATLAQPRCLERGDAECELRVVWTEERGG
jgi:hypothetical protein